MMLIHMGISMLIQIRVEDHLDSLDRPIRREILCIRCDTCGKEWEMRGSKARVLSRKTHACSAKCKSDSHKNGGVVQRLAAKTNIKKYGVENPFASQECQEKIRQTFIDRYGVPYALQSDVLLEKQKLTNMTRYGVSSACQNPEIHRRQIESMRRNHGVDYPMQLEHVRKALREGSIKKWGVPYMMQNPEQRKIIFEKRDKNPWMSKIEKKFLALLELKFGKENVKVQQLIERKWCVDFYVSSIDTWISFDGVYWHGLDRPIDVIRESSTKHDQAIYQKWKKDRELDSYVLEHGMRLIRITDVEFRRDARMCLERVV